MVPVHRQIRIAGLPEAEQEQIARQIARLTGLSLAEALVELRRERR
jgi:hypothetical protein